MKARNTKGGSVAIASLIFFILGSALYIYFKIEFYFHEKTKSILRATAKKNQFPRRSLSSTNFSNLTTFITKRPEMKRSFSMPATMTAIDRTCRKDDVDGIKYMITPVPIMYDTPIICTVKNPQFCCPVQLLKTPSLYLIARSSAIPATMPKIKITLLHV